MAHVKEMLGKTITEIDGACKDSREIRFTMSDGSEYLMYHDQECCEDVIIEEIVGDVVDLIGSPLTMSEEETSEEIGGTWTFYKFATIKGYVTLRWLGISNGYYSEAVDFERMDRR